MEIIVKKVKLSVWMIKQFQHATFEQLETAKVLGFVCNIVKGEYKAMLLEQNGQYFRIEMRSI